MLAGSLAYGEQRMLELARALAISPSLLMVDEPAAGLNAAEVERLVERIRALRQRGVTIIVVEHNMDLVMQVAERHSSWTTVNNCSRGLPPRCRATRP